MEKLIDTHFHLDFYRNHNLVYEQINELNQYTLCMSNSPGVYVSCKHMYKETKYLKFALGFHPQNSDLTDEDFDYFIQLFYCADYIGEVGLDFTKKNSNSIQFQVNAFDTIVKLCSQYNKLISVHLRKSEEEAIRIIRKYNPKKCIIHWYNGSEKNLLELIELGCYFSINTNMINKVSPIISMIPTSRLLVESDGPFTKVNNQKYEVQYLSDVHKLIEKKLGVTDIANIVYWNFKRILEKK
ncbi:MAG: TatD family hydrolase [Bacilli bacterium]